MTIIDTGASNNYISLAKLNALKGNFDYKKSCIENKVTLADGKEIKILGQIELQFQILGLNHCRFTENFKIIKEIEVDCILGLEFLLRQGIKIDFDQMRLECNQEAITFGEREIHEWRESPEAELITSNKLFHVLEDKEETRKEITNIIDQFKNTNPELGLIVNSEFSIDLSDNEPVREKPYPIPFKSYLKIKDEIDKLLNLGIIRKSTSPYGAPAFGISKKNGDVRLVVDYRKLNKKIKDSGYPFPNLWDQLQSIPKSKYFTQIDLTMGYHNLKIKDSDCCKTAFVVPWGHYEYSRVPFGLKTAPRAFQCIMADTFSDLPFVRVFLDDILICSLNKEDHLNHVETVLKRLKEANISINYKKSNFLQHEVNYLGCKINEYGIKPDASRIEKLDHMEHPKTIRQCRRLIGIIEWFRPFIPMLSIKIKEITKKTKKGVKFNWSWDDTNTVNKIIDEIKKGTLLNIPDTTQGFELEVDASNKGIGGTLTQNNKIIGFFSKQLLQSQQNYSIMEKEMFAVMKSCEHFQKITQGSKIIIYTDHANLLFEGSNLSNRISKWKVLMSEQNYELRYKKGKTNVMADHLSRLYYMTGGTMSYLKVKRLIQEQNENMGDKELPKNIKVLKTG